MTRNSLQIRRPLALAASAAMLAAWMVPVTGAQAAASCNRIDNGPMVRVAVGKSQIVRLDAAVERVVVGNPENSQNAAPKAGAKPEGDKAGEPSAEQEAQRRPQVADIDVLVLSPREIYVLGKTIGSTNVVLVDQAGVCTVMDVAVSIDTTVVAATLAELLPGEPGIKVSAAADSLVLSGTVSDASALDKAVDIVSAFVARRSGGAGGNAKAPQGTPERVVNLLAVGSPQQVMIEVKVAEVAKTVLDQFGINFAHGYVSGDGSVMRFLSGVFGGDSMLAGSLSGAIGATVAGGAAGMTSNSTSNSGFTAPAGSASFGGSTTTIPVQAGKNVTNLGVNAQKKDGLVKVLAEPNVMAISGQEGSFLAGGKIFIPVIAGNGQGGTTVTLEEKEYGVSLKFMPTVLGDGRINLRVSPEVSELSAQGIAITAPGITGQAILPSFTTRRVNTTIQLRDGQSFAIGGLMKNNVNANIKAFPILGELPVLGMLFRSHDFQTDRSELVIVVTPHLVKPLPADYGLPTDAYVPPSRSELMFEGRLEGSAPPPAPAESKAH